MEGSLLHHRWVSSSSEVWACTMHKVPQLLWKAGSLKLSFSASENYSSKYCPPVYL